MPSLMRLIPEIMCKGVLPMDKEIVLSARDVEIEFSMRGKTLKAVRKCSLDLYQGETLAIVGESGSGKSVLG